MKHLSVIAMLFLLTFIGCEKKDLTVVKEEPELCWECITYEKAWLYYCDGYSGQGQDTQMLDAETVCGFTQDQIDTRIEAYHHNRTVVFDCEQNPPYSHIRYENYMRCTLLE